MQLLFLGGTRFLGRALVQAALERGHQITLFNRGQSNPGLFPQVEQITGDRAVDLPLLQGRHWDAVIDTSGYVPRLVRLSAEQLAEQAQQYVFISSLSVYASAAQPGITEGSPLAALADESVEEVSGETYGALKALCERAVQQSFPGGSLVIRPGLIVGPYDVSDRFTYWPVRAGRGGSILAPGRPERAVQFIDVRDLAEWNIRLVEQRQMGVYNADGEPGMVSMNDLLQACLLAAAKEDELVWVSDEFLLEQGVEPWMEMPLWIPESDPESVGFFAFDVRRAKAAGLSYRSLAQTVRDTLRWALTRPADYTWRAGLAAEREAQLLRAWQERDQH